MAGASGLQAIVLQLAKEEIQADFQSAGQLCEQRVQQEMQQSIESNVYGAYAPTEYARTGAYKAGWISQQSGSGESWNVKIDWEPTGGHTSYSGQNVDGILDSIIIDGSSSPLYPPGPRDHVSPIDDKIEEIANECLAEFGL